MFDLIRLMVEGACAVVIVFQYNEIRYLRARLLRMQRQNEQILNPLRRMGM